MQKQLTNQQLSNLVPEDLKLYQAQACTTIFLKQHRVRSKNTTSLTDHTTNAVDYYRKSFRIISQFNILCSNRV